MNQEMTAVYVVLGLSISANLFFSHQYRKEKRKRKKEELWVKERETFISYLSREIMPPLHSLEGLLYFIRRHSEDKIKSMEYLSEAEVTARRLKSKLDDAADWWKLKSGNVVICYERVNLSALMESIWSIMDEYAQTKKIEFFVEETNIRQPIVYADRVHTKQVLLHLIKYLMDSAVTTHTVKLILTQEKETNGWIETVFSVLAGVNKDSGRLLDWMDDAEKENEEPGMAVSRILVERMEGTLGIKKETEQDMIISVRFLFRISEWTKLEH